MSNEYSIQPPAGQTSGIIGLVLAIIALVLAFVPCIGMFAVIPGGIALIFSVVSLVLAVNRNAPKGLAIGGLVLTMVAICVSCAWMLGLVRAERLNSTMGSSTGSSGLRVLARIGDALDATGELDEFEHEELDVEVRTADSGGSVRLRVRTKGLEEQLRLLAADSLNVVSIQDSAGQTTISFKSGRR